MNPQSANELVRRLRRDSGGAFLCGLGYIGDRTGLFRQLALRGPMSSATLASAASLNARYVLEWCKAMAAFGYIEFDPANDTFAMTAEQRAILADEDSPWFGAGTFQFTLPSLLHTEELIDAFRSGGGIAYRDLNPEIPAAIDRMHAAWFDHQLAEEWLPAVPGWSARLRDGVTVLDVGCGLGRSTLAMARAYPASHFVGVDPHGPSIERAREAAADLANIEFIEQTLQDMVAHSSATHDLIVAIDCIHDMTDPVGALVACRELLAPDGLVLWSEPTGSDNPLENTDELARLRAALSSYHCLTVSLAAGGAGLGTLIGERGARRLAREAGFDSFEVLPVPSAVQLFFGLSCG